MGFRLFTRLRSWGAFTRAAPLSAIFCLAGAVVFGLLLLRHSRFDQSLPFYETFASNSADHWQAFGGTWDISNGSVRNESTERGAKLVTGSPHWTDYSVDTDLELLGPGDAGVIVRVADAETGVDSYTGYYVGLRTLNNSFFIGRAHHEWQEYPAATMASKVKPFEWYHLHVAVVGCKIEAKATARASGESRTLQLTANECYPSGQVGLRSYSSGGVWRNVAVRSAAGNESKPAAVQKEKLPASDRMMLARNIRGSYLYSVPSGDEASAPDPQVQVQPISSLRLLASHPSNRVAIRGVVVLSTPGVYVQDSTGGVSVVQPHGPPLKVGDEVEVQGRLASSGFHSVLRDASVLLLWEGEPPPPYSVTLNQAASGGYDSTFVEVEGVLKDKAKGPDNTLLLGMEGRSQAFHAIMNPGRSSALFQKLSTGSTLRLRGICVADQQYTHNLEPFALLLRSVEDVQVVAGPPWWSWHFVLRVLLVAMLFVLAAYALYLRARTWRMGAVLEERGRLAHEIHDTLAQSFAGIGFQLQAIRNRLPAGDSILNEQVDLACTLVRHSHEETRRSIVALRHGSSGGAVLADNLADCARRMMGRGSLPVRVTTVGQARALPLQVESAILRIGQEATANAISHAQASRLTITVTYSNNSVSLRVEDDGTGFMPGNETNGFGLAGIRARAAAICAEVTIASCPGGGTCVEVAAPIPVRTRWREWLLPNMRDRAIAGRLGGERYDPHSYR